MRCAISQQAPLAQLLLVVLSGVAQPPPAALAALKAALLELAVALALAAAGPPPGGEETAEVLAFAAWAEAAGAVAATAISASSASAKPLRGGRRMFGLQAVGRGGEGGGLQAGVASARELLFGSECCFWRSVRSSQRAPPRAR